MKKRTQKDIREKGVKFYVNLPDGTKVPWTSKKNKLASVLSCLTEETWSKGVDVIVRYQAGVTNGGTYFNKTSALADVKTFTEIDLVEYGTEGSW